MAAIQHILPEGGYLNENGSNDYAVPNGSYVNGLSGGVTPGSPASPYVKTRKYFYDTTPNRFYTQQRARLLQAFIPPPIPPPPPIPYTNRNRSYFQTPVVPVKVLIPRSRKIIYSSAPITHVLSIDAVVREVLVSGAGVVGLDGVVREVLVHNTSPLVITGLVREVLGMAPPGSGPIPVFPTLPYGFPIKVRPNMSTVIGTSTSDREVRVNLRSVALWEIDLLFEELRDQTQNEVPYAPFAGYSQYEQLVQLWLAMYGQAGVFAFDAPWDDSREDQLIGTGDGSSYVFTIFRTWGQGSASLSEPIGSINQVFDVEVNGVTVLPSNYYTVRNKIYFIDALGFTHPPGNGLNITMSFSFYYICRFVENSQDFEEFSKNRWTLKALKFQSVYWP